MRTAAASPLPAIDPRQHLRSLGHRAHAAREGCDVQVAAATVSGGEVDALAVRRPMQVLGIAIEVAGDPAHVGAVEVHDPELVGLVGLRRPFEPDEGDPAAVWRQHRCRPRSLGAGDLSHVPVSISTA